MLPPARRRPLLVTGSSERNHSGGPRGPAQGKRPRGQAADKAMGSDKRDGRGASHIRSKALRDGTLEQGMKHL